MTEHNEAKIAPLHNIQSTAPPTSPQPSPYQGEGSYYITLYNPLFSSILKMMKRYIFFIAIIFFFAPFATRAEEVNLGSFSIDEIQKITGTPINFHVADKTITADKNALAGWLKIRPALRTSADYSSEAENINFIPTDDPAAKIYFRFLDLQRGRSHIRISTSLALDTDQLKAYLEKAKDASRVDPQNAKLSFL